MKKRILGALFLSATLGLGLASCGGNDKVEVRFNLAYGNNLRTMTYNQSTPLELPNGTTVSAGQLKPMWQKLEEDLNAKFTDVAVQDQKSNDMMKTAAANNFRDAEIYGGGSIATQLMGYGVDGKFANLTDLMANGKLPHFKAYLEKNPMIKTSITAYDGNIYHVPYIAEVGTYAKVFSMRKTWVTKLLDAADDANYDTSTTIKKTYEGFWKDDLARTGDNGGTVTPKKDVNVKKNTNENVIVLMNQTSMNGAELAKCLKDYIKRNYDYENPSELYLGAKAAYDIDELVALFRVIKANPTYLTDGKATVVYPFFTRQSSYREDILRFATYFDGVKIHGSDSYSSRWFIDNNGQLVYTYGQKEFYDVVTYISQLYSEGLFYNDVFDVSNKSNHRSALYGTDTGDKPSFGFMTWDFTASTTADSLNKPNGNDVVGVLPPVSRVNGVWQYYIDSSRVIKSDGWAISAQAKGAALDKACEVFDWFFTEEGALCQNYGMDYMLDGSNKYTGPDGVEYPKYNSWTLDTCQTRAKGDLSAFLRDWIGSLMPVGYQKEIGFEYQYTSENGFAAWKLLQESTLTIPTYAGTGPAGTNKNYYTLIPPAFSLTKRQQDTLAENTKIENSDDFVQNIFNIVLYKSSGVAIPDNIKVLKTWEEYEADLKARGIDTYVQVYNQAYATMQGIK